MNIEEARRLADKLWDQGRITLRSCHECNKAHEHFTKDFDCVISCFQCGRFWVAGIDVTIYGDEG